MKVDNQKVGARIKNIRLSKGWTLEELGTKLNTSKVTVFNWEKGRNLPNKENLKLISDIQGISVEELLHGSLQEYVFSVLQEELFHANELYNRISNYLLLINDSNQRDEDLHSKAEQFLRDNIESISDYIKDYSLMGSVSKIYGQSSLIINLAIDYVNNLIRNFNNKVFYDDGFTLKLLKDITCTEIIDYIGETKYIFECRISLEITKDLGNREELELDYSGDIIVNIFINDDNQHQFQFAGFYALDRSPYSIIDHDTLKEAKEEIVKEVLKSNELTQFNLQFSALKELSK